MSCTSCGCAGGLVKLLGSRQKLRINNGTVKWEESETNRVSRSTSEMDISWLQRSKPGAGLQRENSLRAPHVPEWSSEVPIATVPRTKPVADPHWANGFRVLPEIECIRVDEGSIAPFSLLQEAITFVPTREEKILFFKKGDWERMVHCNTKLGAQELNDLQALRRLARQHDCAFSPSISAAATRFISDARGNISQALAKMRSSQEWRQEFFKDGPITADNAREDLGHGVFYFCGRDRAMRPAIVVRPARAPHRYRNEHGGIRLTRVLIFCLEYFLRYMAIPGQVENICVILDLKNLSAASLPFRSLMSTSKVLSQRYVGRVWRFYVCNMSPMLSRLAGWIEKTTMTDRQAHKILFVTDSTTLCQDFYPDQLENDLGGTRQVQDSYFPFPLPNGSSTPLNIAVRNVHKLLTSRGAQGRLWDPALTAEENIELEYSDAAVDIFKRCNLPLPLSLVEDPSTTSSPPPSP